MANKKLTSINKFYFLEYFEILLRSIQFTKNPDDSILQEQVKKQVNEYMEVFPLSK